MGEIVVPEMKDPECIAGGRFTPAGLWPAVYVVTGLSYHEEHMFAMIIIADHHDRKG